MKNAAFLYILVLFNGIIACVNGKVHGFHGFFVPEEIPTLLSLIYSRLPPTRIGYDSRFGMGFRMGPNADVQFLVELGPQTNTQSLATDTATQSKRNTFPDLSSNSIAKDNTQRQTMLKKLVKWLLFRRNEIKLRTKQLNQGNEHKTQETVRSKIKLKNEKEN